MYCLLTSVISSSAARGRLQRFRDLDNLVVVKIKSGDCIARLWCLWLFFQAEGFPCGIEFNHSITFGILHRICEYARAGSLCNRFLDALHQIMSVKDVVAENQGTAGRSDKIFADNESLRDAFRPRLHYILKVHTEARSIAQKLLETRNVFRGRNE